MSLVGEQLLLRAYLRDADRAPLAPTHQRLVQAARREGLAGATVLRGLVGFGRRGPSGPGPWWSLVEHVPVIVEIVDAPEKVERFARDVARPIMQHGMLTLERAFVMLYRHRKLDAPGQLQLGTALKPLSTVPVIDWRDSMTTQTQGVLMRVFVGESDKADGQPLHQAILRKARDLGLAGATVLRGTDGFGANSVVHKSRLLEMSADLPLVIEIVDDEARVRSLLPYLEQVVREGMITMEHVAIVFYGHNPADAAPGGG